MDPPQLFIFLISARLCRTYIDMQYVNEHMSAVYPVRQLADPAAWLVGRVKDTCQTFHELIK